MGKVALRVNFTAAPAAVLRQLFGEAKYQQHIIDAITSFEGHAHEKEIFHYVNTDNDGDWVLVTATDGKTQTVAISMQTLRKNLSTMVDTGSIKRLGDRSARYALIDFEGQVEADEDDEDEAVEEVAA